jgi:hypothetical protein
MTLDTQQNMRMYCEEAEPSLGLSGDEFVRNWVLEFPQLLMSTATDFSNGWELQVLTSDSVLVISFQPN